MTQRVVIVVLVLLCCASALGLAYVRHQTRASFTELSRLQNEQRRLEIEFNDLQIEQALWAETNRVEQLAHGRLGMHYPDVAKTRVVQP